MTPTAPARLAAWLESAWLARYLERRLSGDEAAWFEAYLLDKPELLAMVEADTHLRDALAAAPATWRSVPEAGRQGEATERSELSSGSRAGGRGAVTRSGGRRSAVLRPGVTAAALAASLIAGVGLGRFALRSDVQGGALLSANPTYIVVDTLRGSETSSTRVERMDEGATVCIVEIAVPPTATGIELVIGKLPPLHGLRVSAEGFVSAALDCAALQSRPSAVLHYTLGDVEQSIRLSLSNREG